MSNATLCLFLAAFSSLVAACGPATGTMPGDDASTGLNDAVVNTDTAPTPDNRPSSTCRPAVPVDRTGSQPYNAASACTSGTQCCSGRCSRAGLCYPIDLGGPCATDVDCDQNRGVCMNEERCSGMNAGSCIPGRCGLLLPGTSCTGNGRMCPGICVSSSCDCSGPSGACFSDQQCCSGFCSGSGNPLRPGTCT